MPETAIPIDSGLASSADDRTDFARAATNWLTDVGGSSVLRPAIVNTQLDPGRYVATTGTLTGIIGTYVWRSVFDQREYLIYVRADRTVWAKDLVTNVTTGLSTAGVAATLLDGAATTVIFAEDSQRLVMAGGGQLQIWTGTGLTARIGATVFGVSQPPLSATHVIDLQNYLVANNAALPGGNNQISWSNLGDGNHGTWSPLNFNTADADPDPIVGVYANLREVFAFGQRTLQVFGIGADPTLPFQSAVSVALGCAAAYSPIRLDAEFAWLDQNRRFVISDGRSISEISQQISKIIRDMSTVSDGRGFRIRIAYWDLLVWVFPTAGLAFVYNQNQSASQGYTVNNSKWFIWRGWSGVDTFAALRFATYAYWQTGNLHIVGDTLFENLWTLSADASSDSAPGQPIVAERVTERLDWGSAKRKRCRKVRFYCKRGINATSATSLDVAKSDDDAAWSGMATLTLGVAGDYQGFIDWYPGGIYRRRQYRVRYSGGDAISITKAVEYWEELAD